MSCIPSLDQGAQRLPPQAVGVEGAAVAADDEAGMKNLFFQMVAMRQGNSLVRSAPFARRKLPLDL